MARMYEYSVIRVEPDLRRGERVNIGIVVFAESGPDIRITETRKAAAIASKDWDAQVSLFTELLSSQAKSVQSLSALSETLFRFDKNFTLTSFGKFEARDEDNYESVVNRLLDTLVRKPVVARARRESSVATEIAAEFRAAHILASKSQDIKSGLVVRDYVVDPDAGLSADFALKNGQLHIATTLDLSSSSPHIGTAATKAITLDLAKRSKQKVKTYSVYSVAQGREAEVREHIAILSDYSDSIFNWSDRDEKLKFKKIFFDAYNSSHPI